jgi:hypothetical protein
MLSCGRSGELRDQNWEFGLLLLRLEKSIGREGEEEEEKQVGCGRETGYKQLIVRDRAEGVAGAAEIFIVI